MESIRLLTNIDSKTATCMPQATYEQVKFGNGAVGCWGILAPAPVARAPAGFGSSGCDIRVQRVALHLEPSFQQIVAWKKSRSGTGLISDDWGSEG